MRYFIVTTTTTTLTVPAESAVDAATQMATLFPETEVTRIELDDEAAAWLRKAVVA